jgi:hypothetical protein
MVERPVIKDDSIFAKVLCKILGIRFLIVGRCVYLPHKRTTTLVTRSWIYFNRTRSYSLWEKASLLFYFCRLLAAKRSFMSAAQQMSVIRECDSFQEDIVYPLQMR